MDGNMNLVRRLNAGKSTRVSLHLDKFFLSQEKVDQYALSDEKNRREKKKNTNGGEESENAKVHFFALNHC
jgi:hypothetical protein